MRKIRELGSLPSDAFDKYQGLTLSQVIIDIRHIIIRLVTYRLVELHIHVSTCTGICPGLSEWWLPFS